MKWACGVMFLLGGCVMLNSEYDGPAGGDGGGRMTDGATAPTSSGEPTAGSGERPTSASGSNDDTVSGGEDVGPSDTTGSEQWWDDAYEHRTRVTFLPREEELENFVAQVDLDYLDEQPFVGVGASQIVVVDPDNGERVPTEVVTVEPDGSRVVLWVRLSRWGGDEVPVDVYFGETAPPTPSSSPWTAPYVGVWHLDKVDGGATPNATQGPQAKLSDEPNGAEPSAVEGVVFRGVRFTGENGAFLATYGAGAGDSEPELPEYISAFSWVRVDPGSDAEYPLFSRGREPQVVGGGSDWLVRISEQEVFASIRDTGGSNPLLGLTEELAPPPGEWHYVGLSLGMSEVTLYVDGVGETMGPLGGPPSSSDSVISLGRMDGSKGASQVLRGSMDEAVLLAGPVSPEWAATMYENQWVPWSTYEQGHVESR